MRNNKGFSMIEVLTVVAIIGVLATTAIASYQNLVKNSRQKQAKAELAAYYRGTKLMIGELGYNPSNFPAVGFKPEGDLYYRFIAADHTSLSNNPPSVYPNEETCTTTED